MPEPTFRVDDQPDGTTRYTCVVPYASQPNGICGHWATDFTLFRQHMEQQHTGLLVKAGEPPAPAPEEPEEPNEPEPGEPVESPTPAAPDAEPVPVAQQAEPVGA